MFGWTCCSKTTHSIFLQLLKFLSEMKLHSLNLISFTGLLFHTGSFSRKVMEKGPKRQAMTQCCCFEEVSSIEWEFIEMTEQEEDLICRLYKLVGNRWALIAGRVPGRKAEEIERFWIMRHGEGFAGRQKN